MSRSRFPRERSLKRSSAKYKPKPKIVVCCEGKTEAIYLHSFAREHGNQFVKVKAIPECGVAVTVVEKAVKEKRELDKEARRSQSSYDSVFKVWGLFDNEHPNIPKARDMARANNIGLGISNPCFELWGLFHICDQDADIHRHKLQRLLKKKMPGYDHDAGAEFNYEYMKGSCKYNAAKKRAERSCARRKGEGDPGGNPSTDVYRLLDSIIKYGRGYGRR